MPSDGDLILGFHRVAEVEFDPFGLALAPGRFERYLRDMISWADPVSLAEVCRSPSRGRSHRPRFSVTFDDGYADNLAVAVPIAARLGVPLTVYVTTGFVGDTRGFWWDRLALICSSAACGGDTSPRKRVKQLRDRLVNHPAEEIHRRLGRLADSLSVDGAVREEDRPLDRASLQALARCDSVSIGAHTRTHPSLDRLDEAEQYEEIYGSKLELERLTGGPVRDFAYPFGSSDASSVAAVRRAGFDTAVSVRAARLSTGEDRYDLPRFMVGGSQPVELRE